MSVTANKVNQKAQWKSKYQDSTVSTPWLRKAVQSPAVSGSVPRGLHLHCELSRTLLPAQAPSFCPAVLSAPSTWGMMQSEAVELNPMSTELALLERHLKTHTPKERNFPCLYPLLTYKQQV